MIQKIAIWTKKNILHKFQKWFNGWIWTIHVANWDKPCFLVDFDNPHFVVNFEHTMFTFWIEFFVHHHLYQHFVLMKICREVKLRSINWASIHHWTLSNAFNLTLFSSLIRRALFPFSKAAKTKAAFITFSDFSNTLFMLFVSSPYMRVWEKFIACFWEKYLRALKVSRPLWEFCDGRGRQLEHLRNFLWNEIF